MRVEILEDFVIEAEGVPRKFVKGQRIAVNRESGLRLVERGLVKEIPAPPVKIYSNLLAEEIWLANSTEQMSELILLGVTESIYIPEEITRMQGFDKKRIKATNEVKGTFPGSLILEKSEEK